MQTKKKLTIRDPGNEYLTPADIKQLDGIPSGWCELEAPETIQYSELIGYLIDSMNVMAESINGDLIRILGDQQRINEQEERVKALEDKLKVYEMPKTAPESRQDVPEGMRELDEL